MLGRTLRGVQQWSFWFDAALALSLLLCVYGLLAYQSAALAAWLTEWTGYPFRAQGLEHLENQGWVMGTLVLSLLLGLRLARIHALPLLTPWRKILLHSWAGVAAGAILAVIFFYALGFNAVNRSLVAAYFGAFALLHAPKEWYLRRYLRRRQSGHGRADALLACPAAEVAERLEEHRRLTHAELNLKAVILLDGTVDAVPAEYRELVLGDIAALPRALHRHRFDLVLLSGAPAGASWHHEVLARAEEQGVEVWYLADFFNPMLSRPRVDELAGKPVVVFHPHDHYAGRLLFKRVFDCVVASALLLALGPLLLALAVAVRLSSPGPALFRQLRTGWKGRPFRMLKFRTMYADAEARRHDLAAANENQGPAFKLTGDPRVTPLGRWLRRLSLDELPQLLNVLRGEMSLVGPRPLPVYETEKFAAFRDHRRYSVLPGLTGLWQVSGRSDIRDFDEWVRLDLEYIDRWSLWLDLEILARTLPAVFSGQGAR